MGIQHHTLKAAMTAAAVIAGVVVSGSGASAACSSGEPWAGTFSGSRFNPVNEQYNPVSARGCFRTEPECRRFVYRESGKLNGGPIRVLSCRRVG